MEKYKYEKYKSKYKFLKNKLNMKGGVENLFETQENIELRSLLVNDEFFQNKLFEFLLLMVMKI